MLFSKKKNQVYVVGKKLIIEERKEFKIEIV